MGERRNRRLLRILSWLIAAQVSFQVLSQLWGSFPGDSPSYYFAARLTAAGEVRRLYDPDAISKQWEDLAAQGVPTELWRHENYFLRPPFAAFLYWPLSLFSFAWAWKLMLLVSLAGVVCIAFAFPKWFEARVQFRDWTPWVCAYWPFIYAIRQGQDTVPLALLVGLSIHLVLKDRPRIGGALGALALVKPHLTLGLPLAYAISGKRRAALWFAVGALLLGFVSVAAVGPQGIRQWIALASSSSVEINLDRMDNVRGLAALWGWGPAGAIALSSARACCRSSPGATFARD